MLGRPDRRRRRCRSSPASSRSPSPSARSKSARREGYDVLMLDTAGRLHIDEALMDEVAAVRDASSPHETLLVADAMTGQDAVNVAKSFHRAGRHHRHRADPRRRRCARRRGAVDARRHRQADQVHRHRREARRARAFHPERIAGRILGMGDVVSLVEKAAETDRAGRGREARRARCRRASSTSTTWPRSCTSCARWAAWAACMGMLPGVGKIKKQLDDAKLDERSCKRQEAIICSMTKARAQEPEAAQRLAPAAHRRGLRHHGAGGQPAAEAVSGHGGR